MGCGIANVRHPEGRPTGMGQHDSSACSLLGEPDILKAAICPLIPAETWGLLQFLERALRTRLSSKGIGQVVVRRIGETNGI
jgi:hypothetical protein